MPSHRPPRHAPGRPLSLAQKRTLVALARSCPNMGDEIGLSPICELTGLKPNAVALALQGLVRRKLAVAHRDPDAWAPTLSGRDGEVRPGLGASNGAARGAEEEEVGLGPLS